LIAAVALATLLVLPAAAPAQQPLDTVQVSARTAEADRLDARAAAYQESNSRRDWGRAAGLREKAARLRAPEDPRAVYALQTAALIRHALNQRPAALSLMEQAGDRAIAHGDVFTAAVAYTNVAYIAREVRDGERLRRYAEKSALLSHSPLLNARQRDWLRDRVAQHDAGTHTLAVAPDLR
jgi:hypothetical protein